LVEPGPDSALGSPTAHNPICDRFLLLQALSGADLINPVWRWRELFWGAPLEMEHWP
jgi:hypothetical protein